MAGGYADWRGHVIVWAAGVSGASGGSGKAGGTGSPDAAAVWRARRIRHARQLTNVLVSRRIEESLGRQRITGLSGHVLVIGLGAVGMKVVQQLAAAGPGVGPARQGLGRGRRDQR